MPAKQSTAASVVDSRLRHREPRILWRIECGQGLKITSGDDQVGPPIHGRAAVVRREQLGAMVGCHQVGNAHLACD